MKSTSTGDYTLFSPISTLPGTTEEKVLRAIPATENSVRSAADFVIATDQLEAGHSTQLPGPFEQANTKAAGRSAWPREVLELV